MVLVPEVVDAVGPGVPVLAAGGIGGGRQIAAALALGAQGAWTARCGSPSPRPTPPSPSSRTCSRPPRGTRCVPAR
nr:nitronate monooxygenase [Parafrankia sp. CH37]